MRSAGVLSFLLITSLACGGNGSGPDTESAPLTWPFDDMDMPIADGMVIYCDRSLLTVNYEGSRVDEQAESWSAALEGRGYVATKDDTDFGIVSLHYDKSGTKAILTVSDIAEVTTVAVTLDFP